MILQKQVDLKPLTSFKIGARAREFYAVQNEGELEMAVQAWRQRGLTPLTVGGLTNVLLPDEDLPGVLKLQATGRPLEFTLGRATVWAGEAVSRIANETIALGLAGLSWFQSLPGTIGGAVWNNAHFGEHFIGEAVAGVTFFDLTTQTWQEATGSDLQLTYDHSYFQTRPSVIATVTFNLRPGALPSDLAAQARTALAWRQNTQPLRAKSAGCFWQNPPNNDRWRQLFPELAAKERLSAGFLIEQAGLKEKTVGGAKVSGKHAAFIINTGDATSADVKNLAELVKTRVEAEFGVRLKEEVTVV